MYKLTQTLTKMFSSFQGLSLLIIRLTLAYGFYEPAIKKLANFNDIVIWFGQQLHLPFPYANAVLATSAEALGVIALTLGLGTRFFAIPLMVTMTVAISMVHWVNGFSAVEHGWEIPYYYFIMLFVLMSTGAGKYSMDETFLKKYFGSGK
jgi:putative oxidoreductase